MGVPVPHSLNCHLLRPVVVPPRQPPGGMRLADGSVLPGFPIDVAAVLMASGISFDPAAQDCGPWW